MGAFTRSKTKRRLVNNSNIKGLSKASIFFLGVDGIIGSGIFLLPGSLYKNAGVLSLLLVFMGAIAVLLFGFCYAEMAARTTGSGGAWLYAYDALGEFPGFQVGLFTWIQGVATIATETAAFLTTIGILVPGLKAGTMKYNMLAIGIIALTIAIGIMGETVSKISDNASSIFKLAVLVIFIAGGVMFFKTSNFVFTGDYDFSKVNEAFVVAFYLYAGFSFLPIAAQRMQNPQKNLPKVLVAVLITCSVVFMGVMFVAIGMLGPEISGSKAPLALAFTQHYGYTGKLIIIIGMSGSILGVILSTAYSTPFISSSLANEHQLLPAFFGKTSSNGTPFVSIVLTGLLSICLVLSGGYLFLVPLCVLIGLVQYTTTAIATYKAQKAGKGAVGDKKSEYRLKFGVLIPVLALLFCIYMVVNVEPKVLILGAGLFVGGLIIYFIEKITGKDVKRKRAPLTTDKQTDNQTSNQINNQTSDKKVTNANSSNDVTNKIAKSEDNSASNTGDTITQKNGIDSKSSDEKQVENATGTNNSANQNNSK